ncbi:conserved hypothetical protein [Burkholderia sp. H160]|nr:conserved hypothetical protein [Burkholderia sp. H160]
MRKRFVPDDFPRELGLGIVSGAQPKLLLHGKDGQYYSGLTDHELWMRYDVCEDLTRQLAAYATRKISEFGWTRDDALSRVGNSVARKISEGSWEISVAESLWIMKRMHELLPDSP